MLCTLLGMQTHMGGAQHTEKQPTCIPTLDLSKFVLFKYSKSPQHATKALKGTHNHATTNNQPQSK